MKRPNTILQINLDLQLTHETATEAAKQQLEKALIILYSIFDVIKDRAIDLQDDNSTEITNFAGTTEILSEIGYALVSSVNESIMVFPEYDESASAAVIDAESENRTFEVLETDDLATAFSQILNNPALPINLYNSLQNAIAEVYSGDNKRLNRFESSPEFLKAVIESCQKDES